MNVIFAAMLLGAASPSSAEGATDFGVRSTTSAPAARSLVAQRGRSLATVARQSVGTLSGAVAVAARWGRVTSTFRSVAHNRRVGGVRNSHHLRGRAVDVARRPGVGHWQIDAALRQAGFHLVESLDEGDHSHFAFGMPGTSGARLASGRTGTLIGAASTGTSADGTRWRMVYAPR